MSMGRGPRRVHLSELLRLSQGQAHSWLRDVKTTVHTLVSYLLPDHLVDKREKKKIKDWCVREFIPRLSFGVIDGSLKTCHYERSPRVGAGTAENEATSPCNSTLAQLSMRWGG